MTEKRPPLSRQHTRTSKAKQDAELDHTVEMVIDGESYKLTPADVTGTLEFRVRRESGMSVMEVVDQFQAKPGIDLLGVFMWICRLQRGEDLPMAAVLDGISYASEVEVRESEPDPPEA